MFSGMPAYLVNISWSDGVVLGMKKVLAVIFSLFFFAALSFAVVGCKKAEDKQGNREDNTPEKAGQDIHPCC